MDRSGSSSYLSSHSARRPGRGILSRCVSALGVVGLATLTSLTPGCAEELDTSRTSPKRGTVGEEMFGVICDRVGAQALREDLTGASFRDICHRSTGGEYADKVDQNKLPSLDPDAVDAKGRSVTIEKQRADRDKAVGRIEALARRRTDLVRALDATFPEDQVVAIKDLGNADPTKSCNAPKKHAEGRLTDQLAHMLGRMGDLYNDGTLPQSTESLAQVVTEFKSSPEAQAAWSRISARQGYRPIDTALGAARPLVAYPNLRAFANASLRLLSADSNPYELEPRRDGEGNRIPVPGPGNAALNKLLEAGHEELLATTADPKLPALAIASDAATGREVLSRPRDNLEMLERLMFVSDASFGGGDSRWIVRRDPRGYARLSASTVASPFVDADKDGLPDVDDRGRFVTADGLLPPSPFPVPGALDEAARDEFGRVVSGDKLLYDYLDTSRTFAAQTMRDVKQLADKGALMDITGGLYVAAGPRAPASKTYGDTTVEYQGLQTDQSPLLDIIHALGAILGDRSADQTLALGHDLLTKRPNDVARLSGAMIAAYDIAQKHAEAKLPKQSTFWDENLDIMGQLVQEPGLLEDVLRGLATPEAAELGNIFARYASFRDEISYDKNDINGGPWNVTTNDKSELRTPWDPNAPKTGKNRSALQRFLGLMSDASGVAACNKPDAKVHARLAGISVTMPPFGSGYGECEVFKIDDLAAFYLDVIAEAWQYDNSGRPNKPGTFYLRNDTIRNGILGIGAATTTLMENSSGITGFVDTGDNRLLTPTPQWLNRLVFFDVKNDDVNTMSKTFVVDLQGDHVGASVCPERVIDDPVPDAPDASPDGKVRGLRNCPPGQWLGERDPNTIFTLEHFGFYRGMKPIVTAFAKHRRNDLFLAFAKNIYKHMPGSDASADECRLPGGAACPRDGMNSYDALVAEAFATDVFPALSELAKALDTLPITRCDAVDPRTKQCTQTSLITGIDAVAAATRVAVDPDYAKNVLKLTDRNGVATAKRNDGTTSPQVTPAHLLTNALAAIDDAYDQFEAQHPEDKGERRAGWKRARSALVDQFLGVDGIRSNSTFANPSMTKMGPVLVDLLRSQLYAHCPNSFTPPYEKCTWAREELVKKAEETMGGPLVATALDVLDAVRGDAEGKKQVELLTSYLLDQDSGNDALASMLASASDVIQLLRDDENLVPLLHVVAAAMDASRRDATGRVTKKSLVDAQMALLARISGRYFDKDGQEICSKEVDPNEVLAVALRNLVTPIKDGDFNGQTPLEVIIDVIADVNRVDPTQPYEGTLATEDYGSVSENVIDFLTNKERGLEQFYEVVRQGTKF